MDVYFNLRGTTSESYIHLSTSIKVDWARVASHAAHRAFTLWALGADEGILKTACKTNSEYQLPLFKPAEMVTARNLNDRPWNDRQAFILSLTTGVCEGDAVSQDWLLQRWCAPSVR